MYYLSLENQNLHPIVIRDMWCVKGVMFLWNIVTLTYVIIINKSIAINAIKLQ